MYDLLKHAAAQHGHRIAMLSVQRLAEVKAGFDQLGTDTSPYYHFGPRDGLGFEAKSVFAVATPCPSAALVVTVDDKKQSVAIPPTYIDHGRHHVVELYLTDALQDHRYNIAPGSKLPCKAIAAHAGLGFYGRNNILYVEGMGSFVDISLFYTDLPCSEDVFYPFKWMEPCENCLLCVANCPSAALTPEHDQVDAERCITNINERPEEFPQWVQPEWHNALVGCTRCQYICPVNQPYISPVEIIAELDEDETQRLLCGELTEEFYASLGMTWFHKLIPRNLSVLLKKDSLPK